jgi:hypothetical protein
MARFHEHHKYLMVSNVVDPVRIASFCCGLRKMQMQIALALTRRELSNEPVPVSKRGIQVEENVRKYTCSVSVR